MSDETDKAQEGEKAATAAGREEIVRRLIQGKISAKAAADAGDARQRRARKPSRTAQSRKSGQVDLRAILSEPLHVLKAGRRTKLDPVEAAIRGQVAKALRDKSLPAIKEVIDLALKHDLVQPPPEKRAGGVLVIPKTVPEEIQRAIFSHEARIPMHMILAYLELHYADQRK